MQGYATTSDITETQKLRIPVFVITARKLNKTTTEKMIRYHFNITINKVKRLYPMATNIHLTHTERTWNQGML